MSKEKSNEELKQEVKTLTLALNKAVKREYKIVTDSEKQSIKHISISENTIINAILSNEVFMTDMNIENDTENKKLICSKKMNDLLLTAVTKAITEYKHA